MVWQSSAPASDSKHQAPLFPGLRENRWVTHRQLQKMFSRLCLCNGLKKKERKEKKKRKKKTSYSFLFNDEQFLRGALSQQRRRSGSSRCTLQQDLLVRLIFNPGSAGAQRLPVQCCLLLISVLGHKGRKKDQCHQVNPFPPHPCRAASKELVDL